MAALEGFCPNESATVISVDSPTTLCWTYWLVLTVPADFRGTLIDVEITWMTCSRTDDNMLTVEPPLTV